MRLKERLLFPGLTLLVVLAAVEAASFAVFTLERHRFALADASAYTLPPERVRGLLGRFDPVLGWAPRYPTPYGERPRERDYGRPYMATFGDSHTFCDEVGDAETWQAYASRALHADVYNFGVGGYGPDQALLRFRTKAGDPRVPLAALGFGLENINRVVGRYRPFYFRETGVPYPKPRFVLRGGRLELLPLPIQRAQDLTRLTDPAFIDELGRDDLWYGGADLPRLGFPYTRLLFSPQIWRQALEGRQRRSDDDPGSARNVWKDPAARDLFFAILDAFAGEAAARGMRPLFILQAGAVQARARREGRGVPGYTRVLEHCRARGYACFDEVELFADDAEGRLERYFEAGGHASPLGNQLIAAHLLRFLGSHGLAPAPSLW